MPTPQKSSKNGSLGRAPHADAAKIVENGSLGRRYPQHPVRHLYFDAPARTNAGAAAGAENARLHVSRCHGGPTQTFFVEPGLGALYAAPPRPEDYLTGEEEL